MKFKIILFTLSLMALSSCSSSDDNNSGNNQPPVDDGIAKFYLPLDDNKTWTYKVITTLANEDPVTTEDNLSVKGDVNIGGKTYKKFETTAQPNGFFSSILNGNGAKIEENTTKVSGKLVLSFLGTNLEFPVSDFVIVKKIGNNGDVLSTASGNFNQTVSDVALKFEYTVKSMYDGSLDSYTSDGTAYSDLRKTKIIINLKATTVTGNFEIAKPQDVLVSNLYYSNTVGMVEATTNINYKLESIQGISFGDIPSTGSQNQKEFLVKK
jgi:hypothetical protein